MAARCWIGSGMAATALVASVGSAETLATLTVTMTADNTFTAFVSDSPTVPGSVVCENSVPWLWPILRTGSFAFTATGTYYLHVAAHDVDFPAFGMLIGSLVLLGDEARFANGEQSLLTDLQHWSVFRDALGFDPEAPISRGSNSDGLWGGFPQLPGNAQFLWTSANDQDIWFTTVITIGETDCDSDGTPDAAEIAKGAPDVDSNGIPDACECLGDVDSSGIANAIDIAIILGVWGTPGGKYPAADIDGSGTVDAQDLTMVLGSWGPCP